MQWASEEMAKIKLDISDQNKVEKFKELMWQ